MRQRGNSLVQKGHFWQKFSSLMKRRGAYRESLFDTLTSCFWKWAGDCVVLGPMEYTAKWDILLTFGGEGSKGER